MNKFFMMLAVLLFCSASLFSQTTWNIDVAHSQVIFTVTHMVFSEVTGWFGDFNGKLVQTNDDFSASKLTATIKTGSINTQNEGRDKHLRSEDFFHAEKYPEMTFASKSFEKTGKDMYKITGDLTMRGVTKSVTLDGKFKGTQKDPWGNTKIAFKATGTVNRIDYGVKYNSTLEAGGLVVSENVEITLNVQLTKEEKK